MTGPRVRLDDVHVRLGTSDVLRGIDLDVAAGSITAVVGASGVGKTTLLRAIAGLVPTAAGTVRFDEADVTTMPPDQRDVGLVFQDHLLFPHRTVAANVGFGPRMAGASRNAVRALVDDWLHRVDLDGYGDRDIATLSGGQRQRVALARALAAAPRVVLLDEPLGALDVALRDQLATRLRTLLRDTTATAILVTHDPVEATSLADRIAVLEAGTVVQEGPARQVWSQPATVGAAQLLGHVNIVPADLLPGPWTGGHVVVPEDAVELVDVAAAELVGTVVEATLRGPAQRIVVAVEPSGPTLAVRAEARRRVRPGSTVGLRLSADRCVHLQHQVARNGPAGSQHRA